MGEVVRAGTEVQKYRNTAYHRPLKIAKISSGLLKTRGIQHQHEAKPESNISMNSIAPFLGCPDGSKCYYVTIYDDKRGWFLTRRTCRNEEEFLKILESYIASLKGDLIFSVRAIFVNFLFLVARPVKNQVSRSVKKILIPIK